MHNGRNFEYISGEDPILGSTMVVPVVQGIQKNVMAISKHYILNNQETHRSGVNELVDEATLMELYGPPFAAAVQESAGVMCRCCFGRGCWLRTMSGSPHFHSVANACQCFEHVVTELIFGFKVRTIASMVSTHAKMNSR